MRAGGWAARPGRRRRRSAILPGRDPLAPWLGRERRSSGRRLTARRPALAALLVGFLLAGLAMAALRIDMLRVRYALNAANNQEEELEEERAALVVQLRELRHPERLAEQARRLGLGRPDRVIQLAAPGETR
jgi:cell division protein FtsB